MLETLLQRNRTPRREGPTDSAVRVVCLTSCLPACREIDVSRPALPIARTLDDVVPLFRARWELRSVLPTDFRVHPATLNGFEGHLFGHSPSGAPPRIELYTDGSFDGATSAWAFAAFATWPQGTVFLGFARGRVSLEGDPHYIGAECHSALTGERSALFWALAWSLQLPDGMQCSLWTDCLVAKGQSEGSCSAVAQAVLGNACRACCRSCRAPALWCLRTRKGS